MFYYSYLQDEFPAVIIDLPLSDEELIRHIDIKERNREMRNNLITMRSMA